ncbi:MAG: hypothetical protein BWZ10_03300 [candidate division BRC1 bacterium ADurb.BinA364]|nr:MAG: hypothetical protein BWZ10_03300 [candidate division BRC1 bacterium ADurb.BinA364]
MKIRQSVFLGSLLCLAGAMPLADAASEAETKPLPLAQAIARARELAARELPEHLRAIDARKTAGDFDANDFFKAYRRLRMDDGYTLDYVYRYEFAGGEPVLFARKKDEKAPETHAEFLAWALLRRLNDEKAHAQYAGMAEKAAKAESEIDRHAALEALRSAAAQAAPAAGDPEEEWIEHVRCDGTPEGWQELGALYVTAKQFYLFWHAAYNDRMLIASREALEQAIERIGEGAAPFPPESAGKARALNCDATVETKDGKTTVSFLTFTNWGGFQRLTLTFASEFPHKLLDSEIEPLVEYDCGILF